MEQMTYDAMMKAFERLASPYNASMLETRLIVITDLHFHDRQVPGLKPGQKGYTINLSPYKNPGLMLGDWTHLTGFSAATLKWIAQTEVM
jgi:hypothetical protein